MKIFQAMTAVLSDVEAIEKDRESVGKFRFAYRGIDDFINALHPLFAKHRVFVAEEILERSCDFIEDRGFHHFAKVRFTFFAEDGSSVCATGTGECIENGDKGLGKCISYAFKGVLCRSFMVPTEEDDPDATNQEVVRPKAEPAGVSKPVGKFKPKS